MDKSGKNPFGNLPSCAADYIRNVLKKMGWRKKASADVQAELIGHFEDALKDCKTNEEREKTAKKIISEFGDAKMLGVLARRAKKRCRPLWQKMIIKAFQTCGIIICLLSIYMFWFFSGRPKITINYVVELNKLVKPAGVDDSQNAAIYYNEAAKKIDNLPNDVNEVFKKSYDECNDIERKSASEWLAKNQEIIKLVTAGSKKPYCWQTYESQNNEMMCVQLPHLRAYRTLGRMMCWNAQLSAADRNYQRAFENIISAYNMGKLTKSDNIIIEQLVGIAIENVSITNLLQILQSYNISLTELQKLQNDFRAIICNDVFKASFKSEKLFIYDEIQRCFTDDFLGSGHIYPQRFFNIMYEPQEKKDFTKEMLTMLEIIHSTNKKDTRQKTEQLFNFWEKVSSLSPAQQKQQNINLDEEFGKIAVNNLFIKMLAPALGKVITLGFQNKCGIEAAKTIIALAIYKREFGQYPSGLQQLIKAGFLDKIPIDPYSDKPLVYKKIKDDFTLYSIGPDFDDDNGKNYKKLSGRSSTWPPDSSDGDAVFWPVINSPKSATNHK